MRSVLLCFLFAVGLTSPVFCQQLKEITNCIGMKMVLLHFGSFTMGSPKDEVGRKDNETPHVVTISKSFYLGVQELSQSQYEEVMGRNPSHFKGAKNPVENVTWDEAVSFCKKLSDMPEENAAGHEYRLPTEAEWEYACRAGSKTAYSFGGSTQPLGANAWFGEGPRGKTHPVGKKKANNWGLFDMHGNVSEWCQDWYGDYPAGAVTDPQGDDKSAYRVIRGGRWYYDAALCRSAIRTADNASYSDHSIGFRVAMSLPTK